jgi:diphosphomevalonate decarboxylase
VKTGEVAWRSPSNIAIVKYWGKYGDQLPRNPSISLTLSQAHTETKIRYSPASSGAPQTHFLFEGNEAPAFKERIDKYLSKVKSGFPFIQEMDLKIESSNSFPHSSGIASSASAMSSLALCLCSIEKDLGTSNSDLTERASYYARLGSGSASRSVYGGACLWGILPVVEKASNDYAISLNNILNPVFQNFHDDILIISSEKKSVSSSVGHKLMEGNPFAKARYQQANKACEELLDVLKAGDVECFGEIAEREALSLHALMMCSDPAFILMQPNSLALIKKLWEFRKDTGCPLYFTLDAGPNVHLLYPDEVKKQASSFIESNLLPLCEEGRIIKDKVGQGPKQLI